MIFFFGVTGHKGFAFGISWHIYFLRPKLVAKCKKMIKKIIFISRNLAFHISKKKSLLRNQRIFFKNKNFLKKKEGNFANKAKKKWEPH